MLNVNNIDNEKISLKDLVADKLNAAAAQSETDEKPQAENILVDEKTKSEAKPEETNNTNLRNTIKSLNQKAEDSVDTDMSKFQLGKKDVTTKNIENAQKAVAAANKAIKNSNEKGTATSKYKAVRKIDKAEKATTKYFNDLGWTKDENGEWDFAPTAIPEKEPTNPKEQTALANVVVLIYKNAKI